MNKHLFIQLYGMIKKSIRNSVAIGSVGLISLATNTVVSAAEQDKPAVNNGNVINRKTEKIPYKTQTQTDPSLPKGLRKVIRPGVEGEREIVTTQDTTTVKSRKPADVVIILDGSTSMKNNYAASLQAARALVNSLTDDDRVIVAMYTANTAESYIIGNYGYQGAASVSMTKTQALQALEALGEPSNARGDITDFVNAFHDYLNPSLTFERGNTPTSQLRVPLEEAIQPLRRPNTTLSIAQFTDGWESQEQIDSSFVNYAKNNAKTFMSVVFPSAGQLDPVLAYGSADKMTAAGHPNVYRVNDRSRVNNDVIEQFKNTALDVVKGEPKTTTNIVREPVDEIVAVGTYEAPPEPTVTRRTEPIPFTTREVEDDNLKLGTRIVQQKGEPGIREFVTTTTAAVQGSNGTAKNSLNFTTKAPVTTNTENVIKPITLVQVYDFSSSYGRKLKNSIRQGKMLIEQALKSPDNRVILQAYTFNKADTYRVNTGFPQGYSTVTLTKDEALKILSEWEKVSETSPLFGGHQAGGYEMYFRDVHAAMGDKSYPTTNATNKPFEDVISEVAPKDKPVSVIQFTDGWAQDIEEMDDTFANWAKAHAKTFMSVVNRKVSGEGDTNSDHSVNRMRALGHPNIYDMTAKDDATADREILDQFKNTAVEKVTNVKGDDQTARIQIGGNGVTVTKATLDGNDLPIVDGKVDVTKKLPDGNHKVEYEANGDGTLNGKVDVDNKEVDKKSDILKRSAETPGSSNTTSKVIKEPVEEIIRVGVAGEVVDVQKEPIPFATEIIEDETLPEGEERVTVDGWTGEKMVRVTYKTVKGKKVGEPIKTEYFITKHMRTKIIHRGVKGSNTTVEKVEIPYQTKIVRDASLLKGERKVVQVGRVGEKTITRKWETWRKFDMGDPVSVSEKVTREPVDEIIHIGTREDIMDFDYEALAHRRVSGHKSVDGMNGERGLYNFYSIADGKRISGGEKKDIHLLRMPVDDVAGKAPVVEPKGLSSVSASHVPDLTVARPVDTVKPVHSDFKSDAIDVLRHTGKQTSRFVENTDSDITKFAIRKLYSSLKNLSVRRWK